MCKPALRLRGNVADIDVVSPHPCDGVPVGRDRNRSLFVTGARDPLEPRRGKIEKIHVSSEQIDALPSRGVESIGPREDGRRQIRTGGIPETCEGCGHVESRDRAPGGGIDQPEDALLPFLQRVIDEKPPVRGPVRLRHGGDPVGPAVEDPIDRDPVRILRRRGGRNREGEEESERDMKNCGGGHGDFGSLHGTRISIII